MLSKLMSRLWNIASTNICYKASTKLLWKLVSSSYSKAGMLPAVKIVEAMTMQ